MLIASSDGAKKSTNRAPPKTSDGSRRAGTQPSPTRMRVGSSTREQTCDRVAQEQPGLGPGEREPARLARRCTGHVAGAVLRSWRSCLSLGRAAGQRDEGVVEGGLVHAQVAGDDLVAGQRGGDGRAAGRRGR